MSLATWVWLFSALYWAYCIYWGIRGALWARTTSRWAIAERSLPMWVFMLAATATSYSGWTYIGHPGLIAFAGLAYAFASFYVITIPITGTFFIKRLWMLGKRYNFITPGDLYSYYYGNQRGWGEAIRILIVLIAFLYSSFYTAVQLMASGAIFHVTTGVPVAIGAIFLAAIVYFYVAAGGIRSVAWVDALQAFLLWLGIIAIGSFVMAYYGGWDELSARISQLADKYLKVPSAWNPSLVGKTEWSGMFHMTYMFALMGIMASPAFHVWAFSNRDPRPFPWQQVFFSSLMVGFALFFFTAMQGLGGRALFEDGIIQFERDSEVVPAIIRTLMPGPLAGFVVVGALAAMQSTGAAYMGTGGMMLMRDVYVRYLRPNAGHTEQIWVGRLLVFVVVAIAMLTALTNRRALVMLGGLATSFGFLMYLPLIDTLYLRKFTRQGVALGLAAGIVAVILTFAIGAWKYPLNLHSAFWGGFGAFVVAFLVSLVTKRAEQQDRDLMAVRQELAQWLEDVDGLRPEQKPWRVGFLALTVVWFFLAIGPGNYLANSFPSFANLPPVWSWQVVWWLVGLVVMWGLAFKAGMSHATQEQIERSFKELRPVVAEVGVRARPAPAGGDD